MSDLQQARAEAAEYRMRFLAAYKTACIEFGRYAEAMGRAQELTSQLHQPLLGGNVEAENQLAKLLIKEPPLASIKREGLEPVMGWGWNLSCEVVPMVKVA